MKLAEALKMAKRSFPDNRLTLKILSNYQLNILEIFIKAYGGLHEVEYGIDSSGFGNLMNGVFTTDFSAFDRILLILEVEDIFPELSYRSMGSWDGVKIRELLADGDERIDAYLNSILLPLKQCGKPVAVLPPGCGMPPFLYDRDSLYTDLSCLSLSVTKRLITETRELDHFQILNREKFPDKFPDIDEESLLLTGTPYNNNFCRQLAELYLKASAPLTPPGKILITDLDNTLWKGIAGEDGVRAISAQPDQNSFHHYIYQKFLKYLAGEGILLAVCSKNNASDVEPVFTEKELNREIGMQLNRDDFVAMKCSWESKSSMIRQICAELNLLPSAVLFVDDNPLELEEVKINIPEVSVLRFPGVKGLDAFLKILRRKFYNPLHTEEDRNRVSYYRNRQAQNREESRYASYADFLRSLDISVRFRIVTDPGNIRPFQLYNKTNQFNLTGERMELAEWEAALASEREFCVEGLLEDRFGDYGSVLTAFCLLEDNKIAIRNIALSCRVFNKQVEKAFLKWLVSNFPGTEEVTGVFRETTRNSPCRNYYKENGFQLVMTDEGYEYYRNAVLDFDPEFIRIE